MIKKLSGGLAALALFVIGTFLLVGYVKSAEERVVANEAPVDVLVVAQPVAQGEDPVGLLRIEQVPARLVIDDAVRPDDSLLNLVASTDLVPGEQLVWSRLSAPGEIVDSAEQTRVEIPEGYLAVTVPVGSQRALGGLVRPGMRVAVVGSFELEPDPEDLVLDTDEIEEEEDPRFVVLQSPGDEGEESELLEQLALLADRPISPGTIPTTHILVHKALVVEVQSDAPFSPDAPADLVAVTSPTGGFLVTLAVPAAEVERIVFAAEWGRIWLANESDDADDSGTRVQFPGSIFKPTGDVEPDADPSAAATPEDSQ